MLSICLLSRLALTLLGAFALILGLRVFCGSESLADPDAQSTGLRVFTSYKAQSIYAPNPKDSWNRIFHLLFTRTIPTDLSDDFPEAAPFVSGIEAMGLPALRISTRRFERIEEGDRAVEPLYPSFLTSAGALKVLTEPRFSELKQALVEAINEQSSRTAVARALMQCDAWAAYDRLVAARNFGTGDDQQIGQRRSELLSLLARFVRKLALTSDEIQSLNLNYQDAVNTKRLPTVFSSDQGWLEIQLLPDRLHDQAADFRRASRVFVKPRQSPSDSQKFAEGLKHHQHVDNLDAAALLVQNLLLDSKGRVVPSPIISDIQFRFLASDKNHAKSKGEVRQYELSRRLLLDEPATGGLVEYGEEAPAYLASAGNDYDFASTLDPSRPPVLVHLHTRCTQCHGPRLTTLMTFSIHYIPPVPPVSILDPTKNVRALYVAKHKEKREDYTSLLRLK